MAKKREDRSSQNAGGTFDNPFAKLAGLKGALPTGPVEQPPDDVEPKAAALAGKIVVRRERAGRGGKTVTIIEGVALVGDALLDFAKELKKALGCGAAVEGSAIVLQGEHEERARELLVAKGAKQVVLGTKR